MILKYLKLKIQQRQYIRQTYKQIIRKENYLKLSEKETIIQLLNYIRKTSYLKSSSSKGKGKNIREITLLILLTGIVGLVLSILSVYI